MKKNLRSIISVLFLAVLLVNIVPIYAGATDAAATPDPAEYVAPASWTALMMYSAANPPKAWEIYEAKEGVNTTEFLGDGLYEIDLKGSDLGATAKADTPQVFLIDIPGFVDALKAQGKNFQNYTDTSTAHDPAKHGQPTDLTIKVKVFVDGQEVRCKSDLLNYGDIEEKGTFRIEIYNIWGLHNHAITDNPPVLADAICPQTDIKVQFSIQGTGYNTEAGAAQIEAANPTPTTAPTVAPTVAPATDSSSSNTSTDSTAASSNAVDNGPNTGLIVGIVVAVVVIAGVVVVLVTRKKK